MDCWHNSARKPDLFRAPETGVGSACAPIPHVDHKAPDRARQGAAPARGLGKRGNSLTPPIGTGGASPLLPKTKIKKPEEIKSLKAKRVRGRRDLVADQMRATSIYWHYANKAPKGAKLPGKGVTFCGWTQIAEMPTELLRVQDEIGHRAYFSGIQVCGLRWVCPCCTASAAQTDRAYVNDGLAAARMLGLFPVMITLTTRHHRKERAETVLAGVLRAEQRLKTVKAWRRFSDRITGYARVLEWTYGSNGHHPHFHTIVLVQASSEAEAIEAARELQPAYMRQLDAAGRDGHSKAAWDHSFQVQGAAAAGSYVAKWGSAEELTGALAKSAAGEGLTPWQLLRLARTAPTDLERQQAASTWWDIIGATKGKAQLYKSEGWKELVEAYRDSGDAAEPAPEPERVMGFGMREKGAPPTGPWLDALPRRLAVREAAEAHPGIQQAAMAAADAIRDGPTDDELIYGDGAEDVELVEDWTDG